MVARTRREEVRGASGPLAGSVVTLTLNAVPVSTNALRGRHWAIKHGDRQDWAALAAAAPRGPWMGERRAVCRTKVRWVVTMYRVRALDADNKVGACKSMIDALVRRGWAVDDSERWLELEVQQLLVPKAQVRTRIVISEIASRETPQRSVE